jgi:N-acetylglutamate synthase-like GNAT family acetyltransferase
MTLRTPTEQEFIQIQKYIHQFELDNRNLKQKEFTAAFRGNELVGFGRLRHHADCVELCSLGVVTNYRRKGIGKAIVSDLIQRSCSEIYLVCIIPNFFAPFGFRIISSFPSAIQEKLDYCTSELVVPEEYIAMIFQK